MTPSPQALDEARDIAERLAEIALDFCEPEHACSSSRRYSMAVLPAKFVPEIIAIIDRARLKGAAEERRALKAIINGAMQARAGVKDD